MNWPFIIGMGTGATITAAIAVFVMLARAAAREDIPQPPTRSVLDLERMDSPHIALRQANEDAERLAGALEAGLRAGWPVNYLVSKALADHYDRIGRHAFERSPRLN